MNPENNNTENNNTENEVKTAKAVAKRKFKHNGKTYEIGDKVSAKVVKEIKSELVE